VVTREEFEEEVHPSPSAPAPKLLSEDDAPRTAPAQRNVPQNQTKTHGYPAVSPYNADLKEAKDDASNKAASARGQVGRDAEQAKQQISKDAQSAKKEVSKDAEQAKKAAANTAEDVKEKADQASKTAAKEYDQAKDVASEKAEQAKKTAGKYEKVAERKFEAGKEEAKKEYDILSDKAKNAYNKLSREAQDDWHKLSKESKKQWEAAKESDVGQELQKPEVWGSMLGVANLAVIGGLAYFTIMNWGKPRWDRRVVTGTVIAASTWFGLQGYILPQTEAVQQQRRR